MANVYLANTLLRSVKRSNYINFAGIVSRNLCNKHSDLQKLIVEEQNQWKYRKHLAFALFSSVLIGSAVTEQFNNKKKLNNHENEQTDVVAGEKRPDLPVYRAEEVSKHDNKKSFWVTYRHGVYDVTKFLPSHPGGDQILNAAGLSIEPFWNVYGMHKTREIYQLLEQYRIGNLHDDDIVDHTDEELWVREPYRDERLIVKTARPFNAEIPPKLQIEHFDTPNELFYVRQHMPVPQLDASKHRLRVVVRGGTSRTKTFEFSLRDLHRFPTTSLRAALMCAGNRRSEMDKVKPVKGISWAGGAISNALWTGVALRDVLLHCGVDDRNHDGKHVVFTGSDIDATGVNFSTSIPLHMAMDPRSRVLLATHMNGQPLPPDHGYPLRVVVPGAPAVRSVKWLESITISEDESQSHWHQKDYRSFNPSKTWETADFSSAPPVYSLPVTSVVCDPQDGDTVAVKDGCIEVRGYAYSGGGAKILRVDVSINGGSQWTEAQLTSDSAAPRDHYAWTLWSARLLVPQNAKQVEIRVKATDSNFNTQPEKFEDIWNIRGILSNAYHKINVKLKR
ncbi:sulfite oxidase isoform X2 [Galleria mellonella]|uniref:sulfite oxidase n=1 Tax=Galleria mellonella TaxID=7137 RepID=A0ABM3MFG7_GALME|nr:sulfite oxidase isoform X2 [Galleria mellonella]